MDRHEQWLVERIDYLQGRLDGNYSLFYTTCQELLQGVLKKYREHKENPGNSRSGRSEELEASKDNGG